MTSRLLLILAAVAATAALAAPAAAAAPLLPYPDDRLTVPANTPTGLRLNLPQDRMPRNKAGKPIDVTDFNRADGFSPGQAIVVQVPGLDTPEAFRRTGAVTIDEPQRSLADDAPVQVINARTGEQHLVWSELDLNAATDDRRALLIRPAVNFEEGERYVVVLRDLRDARGARIGRPDGVDPDADVRRAMQRAGVPMSHLHRAWDFTVASAQSTTGRMLSIRDRTFAELGDTNLADRQVQGRAPQFAINPDEPDSLPRELRPQDGIEDYATGPIARKVRGKLTVPCFLDQPGCPPGSQFLIGADGTPTRIPGNTTVYDFSCNIPRHDGPLRAGLYGHGLFGGQGEIDQGQLKALSADHGFLFCAVDWNGMATRDVPTAVTILQDVSGFPKLVDHVQQGFLGFLLLGRAMVHPDGLSTHPAFQGRLDPSALFYDGNSQGGIYGGSLTAIAPDFERAVLGVPGMNYSTLLQRSVDFDLYANGEVGTDTPLGLYDNYPDPIDQQLVLTLMQNLWDRADPNGYAHHMTSDPLPNTPTHEVLLHTAFGDHQVADVTTEVMARTIGIPMHQPGVDRSRYRDRWWLGGLPAAEPAPFHGIGSLGAPGYEAGGSGLIFWDTRQTPPPPAGNVPPREGRDPHSGPRSDPDARRQKSAFLRPDGKVIDVCGGVCVADGS